MAFIRNNNNNNGRRHNNNYNNNRHRHPNSNPMPQSGNNQQRRFVNRSNQVFDSSGPDGRVRGTALQLAEKYASLARDCSSRDDRVLMLSYLQHAEHYQRLVNEIAEETAQHDAQREQQRQAQAQQPGFEATDAAEGAQNVNNEPAGSAPQDFADGQAPQNEARPQRPQHQPRPERQQENQQNRQPDRQQERNSDGQNERQTERSSERSYERTPREQAQRPQRQARHPGEKQPGDEDDNVLPSFLHIPVTPPAQEAPPQPRPDMAAPATVEAAAPRRGRPPRAKPVVTAADNTDLTTDSL